MIKIKIDLEKIFLIIFFAIFLFIGPGILFGHGIKHDFPYAYLASDAFQHQVRAEAVKDAGNFKYESPYISLGFKGIVGRYPPLIYHLSVIFSYAAGLEVYDAIYFVVLFFSVVSIAVMYIIVKEFSRNVALIALPLAIIVFTYPILAGFTWGHWPSLLAQSFLVAFFWFAMRADLEKSYVLGAIIFSSVLLAHTSEGVFGLIFTALFLGTKLIGRNLKKNEVKNIAACFIAAFVICAYYLVIFLYTWGGNRFSFAVEPVWNDNPGFYLAGFKLLLAFIAAGILFSLPMLKGLHVSFAAAFAMLLSGFLNYAGFGLRSFQIRFFWPIYLSVFFGFGAYMLLKPVIKKWNLIYAVSLSAIFAVLLLGLVKIPFIPAYSKAASPGIMDASHWSALKWLGKNTEADSSVYFFYGDAYSQDALLRNSKRVHHQVNIEDFISSLNGRKIKRSYVSKLPGDSGGGLKKRTGLFSFEDVSVSKPDEYYMGPQDICTFNYLIFDKVSRQPVLAQYNLLIASELLRKSYIKSVFENEAVVVLKNNNIGADCIEERSF